MNHTEKGWVCLYAVWNERAIQGYFSNAKREELNPFDDIYSMIMDIKQHLREDHFYYQPPVAAVSNDLLIQFYFDKFYIIEILYQQHDSWQGILHGGVKGIRYFKSILDLILLLEEDCTYFLQKKKEIKFRKRKSSHLRGL